MSIIVVSWSPISVIIVVSLGPVVDVSVVGHIAIPVAETTWSEIAAESNSSISSDRAKSLTSSRVESMASLALDSRWDLSWVNGASVAPMAKSFTKETGISV